MNNGIDLLLVHPPTRKKVYQHLEKDLAAKEPPYPAALTADFIRRNGFSVRILDADAESLNYDETVDRIEDYNPKIIQIIGHSQQPSASTQIMPGIGALCGYIKSRVDSKVLLTGNHISTLPKRTMQEEACDFVGRGEGYFTVLGLLKEKPLSEIEGLFYRDGEDIKFGSLERVLSSKELDESLTGAAWDLLPMDKYKAHNWHCFNKEGKRQPYASIYTTFGCGMGCSFCMIDDIFTKGGAEKSRIRYRSPEIIVSEMEMLHNKHGVSNFKIIDEMFVLNPRHYTEIAKKIVEKGLGNEFNIWAYARIDTIKEGTLPLLREAGFTWLGLGIESGSAHVRAGSEKEIGEEDIKEVVRSIKSAGICAGCNYIFGLPDDTKETMQQTLDLSLELNGEYANYYCAMAYPGSYLHTQATNTSNLIKKKGVSALEIIASTNEEVKRDNAGKKEHEQKIFSYLDLPTNWDISRPLLPEDKGGPGWIGYSQFSYEILPLPTAKLNPEEVLKFRDEAFMKYFTGDKYLSMMREKFGQKAVDEINFMASQPRLKRKLLGD